MVTRTPPVELAPSKRCGTLLVTPASPSIRHPLSMQGNLVLPRKYAVSADRGVGRVGDALHGRRSLEWSGQPEDDLPVNRSILDTAPESDQIGRASCRERVEVARIGR